MTISDKTCCKRIVYTYWSYDNCEDFKIFYLKPYKSQVILQSLHFKYINNKFQLWYYCQKNAVVFIEHKNKLCELFEGFHEFYCKYCHVPVISKIEIETLFDFYSLGGIQGVLDYFKLLGFTIV